MRDKNRATNCFCLFKCLVIWRVGGLMMNKAQVKSEIQWLEFEIRKLEGELPYKPSKIKQINEYKRQIKQKKLNLALAI